MIKYFCDVCKKEITGWYNELEGSMQSPFRNRDPKKTTLHFHNECLNRMLDYLAREEDHEQ